MTINFEITFTGLTNFMIEIILDKSKKNKIKATSAGDTITLTNLTPELFAAMKNFAFQCDITTI